MATDVPAIKTLSEHAWPEERFKLVRELYVADVSDTSLDLRALEMIHALHEDINRSVRERAGVTRISTSDNDPRIRDWKAAEDQSRAELQTIAEGLKFFRDARSAATDRARKDNEHRILLSTARATWAAALAAVLAVVPSVLSIQSWTMRLALTAPLCVIAIVLLSRLVQRK